MFKSLYKKSAYFHHIAKRRLFDIVLNWIFFYFDLKREIKCKIGIIDANQRKLFVLYIEYVKNKVSLKIIQNFYFVLAPYLVYVHFH